MPGYRSFSGRGAFPAAFPAHQTQSPNSSRSLAARWGSHQLFEDGFLGVPAAFLWHYTQINLSSSEFVFVLQLMSFKWSDKAPFPSYKTIAQRMGITTEMARRHAKSLEEKHLLVRVKRVGQSNAFDLQPLARALEALVCIKLQKAEAVA